VWSAALTFQQIRAKHVFQPMLWRLQQEGIGALADVVEREEHDGASPRVVIALPMRAAILGERAGWAASSASGHAATSSP